MILTALNDYYQRLAAEDKVPPIGFSTEQIDYELLIDEAGKPLQVNFIGRADGKKRFGKPLRVPQSFKRPGTAPKPFLLWDKTSFVLGVKRNPGANEGEPQSMVSSKEYQAFREFHQKLLEDVEDKRVQAFLMFLWGWEPSMFCEPLFRSDMLDKNFVFRMDGDKFFIHETDVVKKIQEKLLVNDKAVVGRCLVSGEVEPLARLHPSIKNVNGAQSSGASIVAFNQDSFESYGKRQGDNSPVSEVAAFGYTTALNYLLRRDAENRQRLQIGDATVVFWAKARDAAHATAAENFFALLNEPPSDEQQTAKLGTLLTDLSQGRPLKELDPMLEPDTQFFVLGLAPNAARLSVRFWYVDTLEHLAQHYAHHHQDISLEPSPWKGTMPGAWRLALQTAPIHGDRPKSEDVLPQLAGELMRSILTGSRYPRSLLNNIVMRFRNDGKISGIRVALCKAVLAREGRLAVHSNSTTQEVPVSLNPQSTHPGYLLGRLFAELENAQRGALGKEVNATIRDRYYGAASATPASVFPMLLRNVQHHLSNMRKKDKGGLAHNIENEIASIIDGLGEQFPRSLLIEDQGRFAIGYYHQSKARFAKKDSAAKNVEDEQGESE
ncbi:MAG: type I-C CRISPR-associated protein Cas8c/Csd1 [Pseudomonadota bacterium]